MYKGESLIFVVGKLVKQHLYRSLIQDSFTAMIYGTSWCDHPFQRCWAGFNSLNFYCIQTVTCPPPNPGKVKEKKLALKELIPLQMSPLRQNALWPGNANQYPLTTYRWSRWLLSINSHISRINSTTRNSKPTEITKYT